VTKLSWKQSMKVGDLVKIKHAPETTGLVTWCDSNIHASVTFKVKVAWAHLDMKEQSRYNFELEVISESR
jgi:hypothetical protein